MPVSIGAEDVWGIDHQYASKLYAAGIRTAADLAQCTESWARKHLGGVVGARLVRELQGICCHTLQPSEDGTLARQSIACTRSFGTPLSSFLDLLGAVAAFTSRAAEKLRRQGSAVNTLTVFISKNRYGTEPPPFSFSTVITLPVATDDMGELLRHVQVALKRIWQSNTVYKKAGGVLDGLEADGQQQLSLFATPKRGEFRTQLMQELDRLNQRFGAGTVGFATARALNGKHHAPWLGKADRRSARFTTCWDELWTITSEPSVNIKPFTCLQATR